MATDDDTRDGGLPPIPPFLRQASDLIVMSNERRTMIAYLAWLEREAREARLTLGWATTVEYRGEPVMFTPTVAEVNAFYCDAPPPPQSRAGAVFAAIGLAVH
jgi:hypothetical protein